MADDDRTLTELEYVELAARRAFQRTSAHWLLTLADELMIADVSQMDGGSETRAWELNRLRRMQT